MTVSPCHMSVSERLSNSLGNDLSNNNAWSSSPSLISIFFQIKKILLKSFKWSSNAFPDGIFKVYNFCFKNNLLTKDLVIYRFSNFNQIVAAVFSFEISLITLSPIDRISALCALLSKSFFSFSDRFVGISSPLQEPTPVLVEPARPSFSINWIILAYELLNVKLCRTHSLIHEEHPKDENQSRLMIPICYDKHILRVFYNQTWVHRT